MTPLIRNVHNKLISIDGKENRLPGGEGTEELEVTAVVIQSLADDNVLGVGFWSWLPSLVTP